MPALTAPSPIHRYSPGSWGPDAVHDLIAPNRWHLSQEAA
jgi:glucose-6-phosphate 1-dehydrogenase